MSAYRCTGCAVNWPNQHDFAESCPECGCQTWYTSQEIPIEPGEAHERVAVALTMKRAAEQREADRLAAREEFERYYAEREVAKFRSQLDNPLCYPDEAPSTT